MFAKALRIGVS